MSKLEEIKRLWNLKNNQDQFDFDGFISERADIDWMIARIERLKAALNRIATEKYCCRFCSGVGYIHPDETAREALKEE